MVNDLPLYFSFVFIGRTLTITFTVSVLPPTGPATAGFDDILKI
jgi:hypothetical protein